MLDIRLAGMAKIAGGRAQVLPRRCQDVMVLPDKAVLAWPADGLRRPMLATMSREATSLVSRIREARYVAIGLKYLIHAPKRGRYASHASLRSDTRSVQPALQAAARDTGSGQRRTRRQQRQGPQAADRPCRPASVTPGRPGHALLPRCRCRGTRLLRPWRSGRDATLECHARRHAGRWWAPDPGPRTIVPRRDQARCP